MGRVVPDKVVYIKNVSESCTIGPEPCMSFPGQHIFLKPGDVVLDQTGQGWRWLEQNGGRVTVQASADTMDSLGIPEGRRVTGGFRGCTDILKDVTEEFKDTTTLAQRLASTKRLAELEKTVAKVGDLEAENKRLAEELARIKASKTVDVSTVTSDRRSRG